MKITPVEESDLPELIDITCSCIQGMHEVPSAEKDSLLNSITQNLKNNVTVPGNVFMKAGDGREIKGYILIKGCEKLSELFVRPATQKAGVGTSLLNKALSIVRERSENSFVWVNAAVNAVPFYKKFGFIDFENSDKKFNFVQQLQYRF